MKTIKVEAVYPTEYASFEEVVSDLPGFIENIYNAKRLHSALGYLSPNRYEEINARTWSKQRRDPSTQRGALQKLRRIQRPLTRRWLFACLHHSLTRGRDRKVRLPPSIRRSEISSRASAAAISFITRSV